MMFDEYYHLDAYEKSNRGEWIKTFSIMPRVTVSDKWVIGFMYKRNYYTREEILVEYGDLFDIIGDK